MQAAAAPSAAFGTACRFRVLGKADGAGIAAASFKCTGPAAPIAITGHADLQSCAPTTQAAMHAVCTQMLEVIYSQITPHGKPAWNVMLASDMRAHVWGEGINCFWQRAQHACQLLALHVAYIVRAAVHQSQWLWPAACFLACLLGATGGLQP